MSVASVPARLTVRRRAVLAARIWWLAARVRRDVHRVPLPDLVARLDEHAVTAGRRHDARRLGAAVAHALTVGGRRPTCLVQSLVLYALLRAQGARPQLVIGLPDGAVSADAHAWIELDGADVGPPPGRAEHVALARYGGCR